MQMIIQTHHPSSVDGPANTLCWPSDEGQQRRYAYHSLSRSPRSLTPHSGQCGGLLLPPR